MGLDDQLCQKARDLYGWEMKFDGELFDLASHSLVEVRDWLTADSGLMLTLASQAIAGKQTYGFVNPGNPVLYHHVATIYAGREHDFQEDLLRAGLLHLRRAAPSRPAIRFPRSLAGYVRSHHLFLLNKDNLEVKEFPGEYIPIRVLGERSSFVEILQGKCLLGNKPHD